MKQDNDKRSFLDKVFAKTFGSKPVEVTRSGLSPNTNFNSNVEAKPGANSLYMDRNLDARNMFKLPQTGEVTIYNPHPGQTDSRPREMASGKEIYDGALASGNRNVPFGTKVYFPDMKKTFTVEDRMNKRYDTPNKHFFDIATTTATPKDKFMAKQFGRQKQKFVMLEPETTQPPVTVIE